MPDFRVFCAQPAGGGPDLLLSADESHHLVTVNRAREGDTVIAFDGQGTEWTTELTSARRQGATLRIRSRRTAPPFACTLTLAQALPKGSVMDDIVRHATEIGTNRIIPLLTARTQVHLDEARSDRKTDKWRTTALEAAKQCGNPFLPEISAPQTLPSLLRQLDAYDLRLVASLHPDARPLKAVLAECAATPPRHALWLVGPEGDFTPEETAAAVAAGCRPVTLGPLVLRCDTAATCALAILRHELEA